MRNIFFGVCVVAFCVLFGGCVSSGPAPQDVKLKSPDGRAVIIKDIYELPLIENKKLTETEIVRVFFPQSDNIKMKCSMTLIKIPSGVSPPKYKQSSSQIIYAISGGGKLIIDNNMVVLKKGIMVYVPPNAAISIINNVNKILELVVVTSPPFETSQMTVLGKGPTKVKVAKDSETELDNDDDVIQEVSEKYRTKRKSEKERFLSVEEYRKKMNKNLLPGSDGKDVISDLLNETKKTETKPGNGLDWKLKMPDSSKVPLKKLEREQRTKLIPRQPQKIKKVSLEHIQDLTPKEHKTPISGETTTPAKIKSKTTDQDDSLEKLLRDQKKQQGKLIPKKTLKVNRTSLKHIQELKPEEHKASLKKKGKGVESDEELLKKLLKDQKKQQEKLIPKKPLKVKRTSLKHIQELSPTEKAVPTKSDTNSKL
jgi:mannose-6-phosphate isomerase-like protein (cupin superfamily)